MHCKDLKGVIAIAAGSLLQHLVLHYAVLGVSQQDRLDELNRRMRTYQTDAATRAEHKMPLFRLTDLKTNGWHQISGVLVKAANTRALVPWLKHLADTVLSPHGAFTKAMRKVFHGLGEADRIMYGADTFFTEDEKLRFKGAMFKMAKNWMYLRDQCRIAGVDAWQITPKCHVYHHLPSQAELINPRVTQVYTDESMIGKTAKVWRASARGPYNATIQHTVLTRIFAGIELRVTADL